MSRLLVAMSCCLSLSVSACSDDSSALAEPPPPTSSSSSPSPSPSPERETPEEFVRRWVEVDREMQNSGETTEYRAISEGCRACNALADQIEGIYQAGGYVKTEGWSVKSLTLSGKGSGLLATVRIISAPTEYRETADSVVKHLEGGSLVELMSLRSRRSSWVLVDLEQQAQ